MATAAYKMNIPATAIAHTSAAVKEHFAAEFGERHSEAVIEKALRTWLDGKIDLVMEEMPELLTSPGSTESKEFARILHDASKAATRVTTEIPVAVTAVVEHPMFAGNRDYSPARLTAMVAYLSEKGVDLYKTKLNKMLFYADLTAFYLTGQGISGSRYLHLPFGPVPENYEEAISHSADTRAIKLGFKEGSNASLIEPGEHFRDAERELSPADRRVLDWVAETYGHLTTAEITDLSHEEMAYKNTRRSEPIAYRYAEFLKTLPPKNLLA
jgi:uncharacterized phage-associated protein